MLDVAEVGVGDARASSCLGERQASSETREQPTSRRGRALAYLSSSAGNRT